MTKWDREYIKLCKKILVEGKEVENRTGINTIKIPSYHLHFNLQEEFPVLTTKQLYFRQAILEMLWIYQAQSNDVRWLQERDVHIWDEWQIDSEGYWKAYQRVLEDNKIVTKEIIKKLNCKLYINPDGNEWKRAKWNSLIKKYWKLSEKLMVKHANLLICDSKSIEKYIRR